MVKRVWRRKREEVLWFSDQYIDLYLSQLSALILKASAL
jgi:hypothetical protein